MSEPPTMEGRDFSLSPLRIGGERISATKLLAALLVLAVLYTLYFARGVVLPIVFAILLALILAPAVRALSRLRIPRALGAALVVGALSACLVGLVGWIYDPAAQWIEKAPATIAELEHKLRGFKKSVEGVAKVAEKMQQLANPAPAPPKAQPAPAPASASLLRRTFSTTLTFVVTTGTTFVLLYFLLATSDLLMQKIVRVMPTLAEKERVAGIARAVEARIASYFGTITLINAGLGVATGLAMYWLGMPNPVLWGVMVFALNYFPYVGAATGLVVLTMVAALTFEELRDVMLVPLVFFTFTVLEGQFVTPLVVGRNLILNPVAILLSMLFWVWLWGVLGALLAVPILLAVKVFCEHHESLQPLDELICGRTSEAATAPLSTRA